MAGRSERLPEAVRPPELPVDSDVVDAGPVRGRARAQHLGRQVRQTLVSRWDVLVVIALGGSLGAAARYGVGHAVTTPTGGFPWSTLAVNVTGCFALGLLMVFVVEVWAGSRYVRPFLGVGVLGGYTTFSTYALEVRDLLAVGRQDLAGAYLAGSLAAGLTAVWVGIMVGRLTMLAVDRLRRRRLRRGRRPAAPQVHHTGDTSS